MNQQEIFRLPARSAMALLAVLVAFAPGAIAAQESESIRGGNGADTAAEPEVSSATAGAPWHHLHLAADDSAEAAKWYARHMEGDAVKVGEFDIAAFGETFVVFLQRDEPFEGSVGSSVDHIGFSFAHLDAKMAEFEEAGIKIVVPVRKIGSYKIAFVEDPWGTKIEVMEDTDLLGFHHVHLHTDDVEGTQDWYLNAFGGEKTRFANFLPAVRYDKMWLIVQPSGKKAGTAGRSVDHLGWAVEDIDAAAEKFRGLGMEVSGEPVDIGYLKYIFVTDPNGVSVEVVEPSGEPLPIEPVALDGDEPAAEDASATEGAQG